MENNQFNPFRDSQSPTRSTGSIPVRKAPQSSTLFITRLLIVAAVVFGILAIFATSYFTIKGMIYGNPVQGFVGAFCFVLSFYYCQAIYYFGFGK